ncbi:unnamed protein product, partial [marine sediment metagenome]
EDIEGYDFLGAEAKPYDENGKNLSQTDIDIFRCLTGTNNWVYFLTIKPTNHHWKSYSISSLVMKYMENGIIDFLYEGRYASDVNDYKIGHGIFGIDTKISLIDFNPFMPDRLVSDDWTGIQISGHRRGTATKDDKTDQWHAVVYELVNDEWVEDYTPTYQNKTIGEYYFSGHFYIKNQGMWQEIKESNGGNVKPEIKLVGNKLSVIDPIAGVKYNWNYWDGISPNKFTEWMSPTGDTYDIPSGKQKNGYEFWCYPDSEASNMSNREVYKSD